MPTTENAGHEGEPVGKFGDGMMMGMVHRGLSLNTRQSSKNTLSDYLMWDSLLPNKNATDPPWRLFLQPFSFRTCNSR
jgi:hypothetical protein